MTVQRRPTSPAIDSFTDLQTWLTERIEGVNYDLRTMALTSQDVVSLMERRATLYDVAWVIRERVAAEQTEREQVAGEDSVEAQWRERYPDADELELRRLGGDR